MGWIRLYLEIVDPGFKTATSSKPLFKSKKATKNLGSIPLGLIIKPPRTPHQANGQTENLFSFFPIFFSGL